MIKRNIFYNTLYQLVNMIIPILTTPYLARVIGAEGVGISAYAKCIAGYFVLFSMQGLNNYGNRTIALANGKEEISRCFWEIYIVQLISSIISLIAFIGYIWGNREEMYAKALVINSIYVISAIFDINWFYYGIGQFKLTSVRNIIVKIISAILIWGFVKSKKDILIYIGIVSFGFLTSNIILWKYLKNYIQFVRVSLKDCIKHIKPNFILFIPVLSISVYKLMDKIMLGNLSDVTQIGYYENATNIITMPLALITAMGTVMLPKISSLIRMGKDKEVQIYNRDSIQLMIGVSLPFAVGVSCIAENFIPWFLGEEFKDCIIVLRLLAITCPFVALGNVVRNQCIIPFKEDFIYIKATILGAGINFIINYTLIPDLGAVGAAIGTIGAEMCVTTYQCIKGKKYLDGIPIIRDNFIFLLASILMGGIIKLIDILTIDVFQLLMIQIIFAVSIYILIIYIYFYYFDERGIEYWLKFLKIKKS